MDLEFKEQIKQLSIAQNFAQLKNEKMKLNDRLNENAVNPNTHSNVVIKEQQEKIQEANQSLVELLEPIRQKYLLDNVKDGSLNKAAKAQLREKYPGISQMK